jgi:hypothetical protein
MQHHCCITQPPPAPTPHNQPAQCHPTPSPALPSHGSITSSQSTTTPMHSGCCGGRRQSGLVGSMSLDHPNITPMPLNLPVVAVNDNGPHIAPSAVAVAHCVGVGGGECAESLDSAAWVFFEA